MENKQIQRFPQQIKVTANVLPASVILLIMYIPFATFFLVWQAADDHCYAIYGGNIEFE